MPAPADVLAFIDWVLELLWWEEVRSQLQDGEQWQSDMSWDEIAASGVDLSDWGLVQLPGEQAADVMANAQLYWPAIRPTGHSSCRTPAP